MRRVPFNKIEYEHAKTIIAIQRMLEPNLFGGVNRWIGTEGPYLRGIISGILTDSEYKKDIIDYLEKHAKSSKTFVEFKQLLLNTKTIADFDKWTAKQRKSAIRYLPKENWIKELNLKKLSQEREDSIDLPIEMVAKEMPMKDEKGNIVEKKDGSPYMVTTFILEAPDEIHQMVKDAVGDTMYNNIISRPFAEWTTEEMEQLAIRINDIYTEGKDLLEAKRFQDIQKANEIRRRIEEAVKKTNIVINDDDTPEEKKKKQDKINKILGYDTELKGTAENKQRNKFIAKMDRLINGMMEQLSYV